MSTIPPVSSNPVVFVDDSPTWAQNNNQCPRWLTVVRDACEIAGNGTPESLGKWWAGGSVEEYEHFRVIHKDARTTLVSKTVEGERILREANHKSRSFYYPVLTY